MEVVISVHTMDFDFNSARSSPCVSAPSTPKRFGDYYFSAPTSPTKLSEFYRDFDEFLISSNSGNSIDEGDGGGGNGSLAVPFDWEEKPRTPKSKTRCEDDFAFAVIEEPESTSLSAEELFDGGMIKPLKPPPRLQLPTKSRLNESSIQKGPTVSPISRGKRIISNAFSPRQKKEIDTFAAAEQTQKIPENERGRERQLSSSGRRGARSVSPFRVSQYPWEEEQQPQEITKQNSTKPPLPSTALLSSSSSSSSKGYKKWSFKDFFLFRSASEGRAANNDPLRKYTAAMRKQELDVKNSSFRGYETPSSRQSSRRKGPVSAHELHYTANRAVSEQLKKKTFLPYKRGILGRLAFNPAIHALSNGFGFSSK